MTPSRRWPMTGPAQGRAGGLTRPEVHRDPLSRRQLPQRLQLAGRRWPQGQRPRRRELAWQSIETNQFGTNEFMEFCESHRCRADAGRQHGHRHHPGCRRWSSTATRPSAPSGPTCAPATASATPTTCVLVRRQRDGRPLADRLTSEAAEYGNKALEAAKMMKWQDPTIETVLCGSSNDRMPTYPEWDRIALEIA